MRKEIFQVVGMWVQNGHLLDSGWSGAPGVDECFVWEMRGGTDFKILGQILKRKKNQEGGRSPGGSMGLSGGEPPIPNSSEET